MKIDRVILTSNNNRTYYEFWNPLRKLYEENFGIKATLIWLGEWEEVRRLGLEGEIIVQPPHPKYHIPWQTTWALFYYAGQFPYDTSLIIGIDQIPLSSMFLRDMIKDVNDDYYVMMIDDAYRPNYWSNENGASPSSYHIAKGRIMNEVYDFKGSFHDELDRVYNSGVPALWESTEGKWGIDESYSCKMLRDYKNKGGIVKTFGAFRQLEQRRIECYREKETPFDAEKLKQGWYSESHVCRPYSAHKEYIDKMISLVPKYT